MKVRLTIDRIVLEAGLTTVTERRYFVEQMSEAFKSALVPRLRARAPVPHDSFSLRETSIDLRLDRREGGLAPRLGRALAAQGSRSARNTAPTDSLSAIPMSERSR